MCGIQYQHDKLIYKLLGSYPSSVHSLLLYFNISWSVWL